VSGNTAGTFVGCCGTVGGGGGIHNIAVLILTNSIVGNNSGGDCIGTITSHGHNLDSDGSCGLTGPGDIPNGNTNLGGLALNPPGTTATHELLPGSDAIDAVPVVDCSVATDQRGIGRPQGPACDIGAFEVEVTTAIFSATKDSFLRPVSKNTNEGANRLLHLDGKRRLVVDFDLAGVDAAGVTSAKLVLTINNYVPPEHWGTGQIVDAHRLLKTWPEGNGAG